MPKKLLIILGPTASGKTALAVKLAREFKGEIISADSRQVYRGLDIGTGKDLKEYKKIPYHLIDIISPKKQLTLADWQALALRKIGEIQAKGKLPILCGGTGLYISSIVEGYVLPQIKSPKSKVKSQIKKLKVLSLNQLLARLKKIDFKTYKIIDKKNRRRVQRALEIYYQTGQTKSAQLKKQKPDLDILQIGIKLPREVLYQKIDKRLKVRLEKEGMVEEIKKLRKQSVSWQRLEDFGLEYRWVGRYLAGKIGYETMFEELRKAIHHYAKRQMTWFKRDGVIRWAKDHSQTNAIVKNWL